MVCVMQKVSSGAEFVSLFALIELPHTMITDSSIIVFNNCKSWLKTALRTDRLQYTQLHFFAGLVILLNGFVTMPVR